LLELELVVRRNFQQQIFIMVVYLEAQQVSFALEMEEGLGRLLAEDQLASF
jgi:hypothetical protein